MMRKILVVAAAAAMPISALAAFGGVSGASLSTVNATNYTVDCTNIAVTATFTPALTTNGSAPSDEATALKGKGTGCTATPTAGGTAVSITSVGISGTIHAPGSNHTCTGLVVATSETGSLNLKWVTALNTPKLVPNTSVVNPTTVQGGGGANGNATFALNFGTATSGPFQGTDNGTSSVTSAMTTTSISAIQAECAETIAPAGLGSIKVVANTNPGAPVAIHAG